MFTLMSDVARGTLSMMVARNPSSKRSAGTENLDDVLFDIAVSAPFTSDLQL